MPSPSEIRVKRIEELLEWYKASSFSKEWTDKYGRILRYAKMRWPRVTDRTLESYARATVRYLEMAEN